MFVAGLIGRTFERTAASMRRTRPALHGRKSAHWAPAGRRTASGNPVMARRMHDRTATCLFRFAFALALHDRGKSREVCYRDTNTRRNLKGNGKPR